MRPDGSSIPDPAGGSRAVPPAERPAIDVAPVPRLATIDGIEWWRSDRPMAYAEAVAIMERRVAGILAGTEGEAVWLLEHQPVYTGGTSARAEEVLAADGVPVVQSGRGGRYTFHGPGQRVAYLMLDLRRRQRDVRALVAAIESWVIAALAAFGIIGERRQGRVGIWVRRGDGADAKIAAIGIRIRRWVCYHGVAINVAPDLRRFDGIVPCGLSGFAVTSLHELGVAATLADLDRELIGGFRESVLVRLPPFTGTQAASIVRGFTP